MEQKGCFIGFTFGNRHSSELGIFRTSSSNRYEFNLVPPTIDIVTEVPNKSGQQYWSSSYTKRDIPISFAFYGLSEEQISLIKQVFNDKKIHSLILDEEPYKVWSAKLTGSAIMKTICQEHGDVRFYCGEGTFVFTAYYPFARSRYQYIEDYTSENIPEWREYGDLHEGNTNEIIQPALLQYDFDGEGGSIVSYFSSFISWIEDTDLLTSSDLDCTGVNSYVEILQNYTTKGNLEEWREASKIPSRDKYPINYADGSFYNAGDLQMPFKIYFLFDSSISEYYINSGNNSLRISGIKKRGNDKYFVIDMFTHTIQGCDENYKKTKNLYNNKIVSGDFFNLPIGKSYLFFSPCEKIEFNYLYI